MMTRGADWQDQLTHADRRREHLGWVAAAVAAGAVAAGAAIAVYNARDGVAEAEAILINLEPPAAAPPAEAVAPPAPDVPQTDAPEAPDPIEETAPPPEPVAESTPLPEPEPIEDLPPPQPDEVALPDAPPPPPPPKIRPPQRPERPVRQEPVRERAAPAPSSAAAPTPPRANQGQSQQRMSAGQVQRLEQQWGSQIRARIQRFIRGNRERGQVMVYITVSLSGQLTGVSLTQSSGSPDLDQNVMRAVQRAQGSLPPAPAGLTEPGKFNLPLRVD